MADRCGVKLQLCREPILRYVIFRSLTKVSSPVRTYEPMNRFAVSVRRSRHPTRLESVPGEPGGLRYTTSVPECPVCGSYQPRTIAQSFSCDDCGTDLKIAGSTIAAAVLTVVLSFIVLLLAKPWMGRGAVIALGLVSGYLLPWLCFVVFYRLEPTRASLDLNQSREGKKER